MLNQTNSDVIGLNISYPEFLHRVGDCVGDHGKSRARAALPTPSNTERMTACGNFADFRGIGWQLTGSWYCIVLKGGCHHLPPFRVVSTVLKKSLPDALSNAAVGLAINDQWVNSPSDIVDGGIADDLNGASFGIQLKLAYVASIRIGALHDCLVTLRSQLPFEVRRNLRRAC